MCIVTDSPEAVSTDPNVVLLLLLLLQSKHLLANIEQRVELVSQPVVLEVEEAESSAGVEELVRFSFGFGSGLREREEGVVNDEERMGGGRGRERERGKSRGRGHGSSVLLGFGSWGKRR